MSIDFRDIDLTDEERQLLAGLVEQTGRPSGEILREVLRLFQAQAISPKPNGPGVQSLYEALLRKGLIGCIDGPADLGVNPLHMEGFGRQ